MTDFEIIDIYVRLRRYENQIRKQTTEGEISHILTTCPLSDPSSDRFRQTRSLKKRSKPLTAHNITKFFHNIPLKVTLAIRSDFPRRFEQAFRSNSRDIFGDLSTQHGELEWRTLLPPQRQPIRFRVGETVGLARKE